MQAYTNRHIWKITNPLLISLLMENLIGLTDVAFLGRVGDVELGASALAGVYFMAIFMLGFGFSIGVQILIARRNGEGRPREIGKIFQQGLLFLLCFAAVMFFVSKQYTPRLLRTLIESDAVYAAAVAYLNWRVYGFFFSFAAVLFRAFYVGTTNTRLLTANSIIMVLTNIVLNYILIFGKLGCPALGIAGAAIASGKGLAAVNGSEWIKVIYGLVLSLILGFAIGYAVCRLVVIICRRMNRQKTNRFFSYAQILGAACMSFMHGAQDGQKFIGVLFLGIAFSNGETSVAGAIIPVWLMILCSAVMGLGTSVGGEKIIRSVGMDMVKLEKYQGFSADMAASLCLLLSSVFGIPVSTTHTKTSAIMGVGASKRLSSINFSVVREMMLTWVFTFPGCGIISFLMTKLFLAIF